MFDSVLIANRGEISVRISRTLRALGVRSIAVYSDADADAAHVLAADEAIRIGPAQAAESYLKSEAVIEAALVSGAQAIHPGYGFLSESSHFAAQCQAAGVVFIGPSAEVIDLMGDKIRARQTVSDAGVPVVPGLSEPRLTDEDLIKGAQAIGFPVLIKPSAGGGGKGMRTVSSAEQLAGEIAASRREALRAFGDDTLFVERWIPRARHIEVQVFGDSHGQVVHLGERECSLQRRHQKIVEESPAATPGWSGRTSMLQAAVDAAAACGYQGAGTVEFIVPFDSEQEFFFLEMNTRLQVEHPVTELVTGLDLVEWQLRVASGEPLPASQSDIRSHGHAVEARLYAEDPGRDFLPTGGPVVAYQVPADRHVRVDSGLCVGSVIGSDYDPMLAKVAAWGETRDEAIRRLRHALTQTVVLGVQTNTEFLWRLLGHPLVAKGDIDTALVEREVPNLVDFEVPRHVLIAALLADQCQEEADEASADPWASHDGWRSLDEPSWSSREVRVGHGASAEVLRLAIRGRASDSWVKVEDDIALSARATFRGSHLRVTLDGHTRSYVTQQVGSNRWISYGAGTWTVDSGAIPGASRRSSEVGASGPVTSPMPGKVVSVSVKEGDKVVAGQPLVTVEAMKMEHNVSAPADGIVTSLRATVGMQVAMDEQLLSVLPEGSS